MLLFGQEHLSELLQNFEKHPEKIPSSILISGPYGCGKTTIANTLIRYLDAKAEQINGANNRGVGDVRDWIDLASRPRLDEGNFVFLVDEIHQLTKDGQNAFLTITENPPTSTYFIACTSEPHMMIQPLRSRFKEIKVKLLEEEDADFLIESLEEKFEKMLSKDEKAEIIRQAGGHARNICKLFEMLHYGGNLASASIVPNQRALVFKKLVENRTWKIAFDMWRESPLDDEGFRLLEAAILDALREGYFDPSIYVQAKGALKNFSIGRDEYVFCMLSHLLTSSPP